MPASIWVFGRISVQYPIDMLIPGIGFMPHQYNTPEEEARLLYMGMTRAIDQLIMTCVGAARRRHRSSEFTNRLEMVLGKVGVR